MGITATLAIKEAAQAYLRLDDGQLELRPLQARKYNGVREPRDIIGKLKDPAASLSRYPHYRSRR
jgi:hypothetical protein